MPGCHARVPCPRRPDCRTVALKNRGSTVREMQPERALTSHTRNAQDYPNIDRRLPRGQLSLASRPTRSGLWISPALTA